MPGLKSMATLEGRKTTLSFSSNPVLLLTMTSHSIDFGQSGSSVPAVSPPSLQHTPNPLTEVQSRKQGLSTLLFSNNQNTGALRTLFSSETQIYNSTKCLREEALLEAEKQPDLDLLLLSPFRHLPIHNPHFLWQRCIM